MQAAKRTPVNLEEWAVSMMEQNNRKSYLGPPAPKSLRDAQTPTSNSSSSPVAGPSSTTSSIGKPPPISKSSRTPQQSPYPSNSASADIPLKMANDPSSNSRYVNSQAQPQSQSSHYYSSSRSTRSPPPPSLEHLSLESRDDDDIRAGRRQMRQQLGDRDTASAVDGQSRPFMSPRSASSNNMSPRTNLGPASLPLRAAPPSGPPPPPPVSAGGNWRSQPGSTPR